MNYSVLMTFSVVLFAVLYYVLWARKEFHGPIVENTPYDNAEDEVKAATVSVVGTIMK